MPKYCGGGYWEQKSTFRYSALDEDGTGNLFETSQTEADTPTLLLSSEKIPAKIKMGTITRIHFKLNPTNAETYILRLYEEASADDYHSSLHKLWESDPLRADDEEYDMTELDIDFTLKTIGKMYFKLTWTGAPGNTPGYISVSGKVKH